MSQSVALATRNKQPVNIIVRYKLDASIYYVFFLINDSLYLMPRICLNVFILSYEPYVQDTIKISLTLNSKKKVIKCASLVTWQKK